MRARVALLAVAVGAAALLSGVGAARAAAPTPSVPPFGSYIDGYARYEPETGCSPTETLGAQKLRALIQATYGTTPGTNIVRPCSGSESGHEEGRSLDWMTSVRVPDQYADGYALVGWLLATDSYGNAHAMARRLGVMYVIWNGRMWRAYDPTRGGTGWTEYSGCLQAAKASPSYDSTCHRNHVHISLGWAGARGQTTYYTRACMPPAAVPPAPAPVTTGLRLVPVVPYRVANTASGWNTGGPCRLGANQQLDVPVLGRGGVPPTGVAAVVLQLTGSGGTSTTSLEAFPAGAAATGRPQVWVPVGGRRTGLAIVPVGSNGLVRLRNSAGALSVQVDVVGYLPADGTGAGYLPTAARRLWASGAAPLEPGVARTVPVAGVAGVPATGVRAVVLGVRASATASGDVSVLPADAPVGAATSSVATAGGTTVANRVVAKLSATGALRVTASVRTNLLVDVVGWYADGPDGLVYVPGTGGTRRAYDSAASGSPVAAVALGAAVTAPLAGAGVPADAKAVVLTVTGSGAAQTATVTTWPSWASPAVGDFYVPAGATVAGTAVVPVGADLAVRTSATPGGARLTGDVVGWFR